MSESSLVALTVVGNDRPGIAAAVTRVLYELGCNLEDASSTILRGHFAMMLIVRAPESVSAAGIEQRLAPTAHNLGLVVAARPVEETEVDVPAPTHMVSVYGADRPGIVFKVTEALAKAGANITDFTSRVIGSEDEPVYALMLEVEVSEEARVDDAVGGLEHDLDVDISIHRIDADVL